MIPMSELVQDRVYRKFLDTDPNLSYTKHPDFAKPWVVFVQRKSGGSWGTKSFWTYAKALKFFNKAVDLGVYDAALNNRRRYTAPPTRRVRIKNKFIRGSDGVERQATTRVTWKLRVALMLDQPEHLWCGYCRRPTVFKYYSKHKRLADCDASIPRCCICGASARIATPRTNRQFS